MMPAISMFGVKNDACERIRWEFCEGQRDPRREQYEEHSSKTEKDPSI